MRRLIARPHPSRVVRTLVTVVAAVAIFGIGVVDSRTGPDLSLAVFYLLPVSAGAVTLGSAAGLALAAESATVWVFSDAAIYDSSTRVAVHAWNGGLRFFILAVVVALLAGLRDALASAHRSESQSREFLALAAHQLRTPVAGVRTSAEALLAAGATPAQEPLLMNLATESARAGRLVASLLRMARLDQGIQDGDGRRSVDIARLCRYEAERVRGQAPRLRVDILAGADVPSVITANPDAIRDALANLLDNARRHAVSSIQIHVVANDRHVEVAVNDDGPGLPPGAEEHAFERFVSLDSHGGAGLGLSIARGLAASQGGSLTYRSGRFVLTLPPAITTD